MKAMHLKKQILLPAITLAIAVNCGMIGIDQLSLPAISKAPSKGKEESKGNDKKVQESFVQTIQKLEKARPYTKQSLETALGAKLDAPVSDFMTCSGFKQKPIALVKLFWSEHSMGPVVLMLDAHNTITLPIIKRLVGSDYTQKTILGYSDPLTTVATKTIVFESETGFTEYEFVSKSGKLSRVIVGDKVKGAEEIGTDKDAEHIYAKLEALMKARASWSKSASELLNMNMYDGASGQVTSEVLPYALFTHASLYYGQDGKATSIKLYLNRNSSLTKDNVLAKYGKPEHKSNNKLDKTLQYESISFVTADKLFDLTFDFGAGTNGKPQLLSISIGDNETKSTAK